MKDYSKNKWWKEEKPVLKSLTYIAYPNLDYIFPKTKTSVTACILLLCIAWGIGITLTLWVEFWDTYALAQVNVPKVRIEKPEKIEIKQKPKVIQGEVSAYNLVSSQTDSTPCITASNLNACKINKKIVANNCQKFGTKVSINNEVYEVQDRMNRRYGCEHFDILVDTYEEAIDFGRQQLAIAIY